MIKKIATSELCVGMYVHDLDCKWMEHPFAGNRFLVKKSEVIKKISSSGIRNIYIDTDKGTDLEPANTQPEIEKKISKEIDSVVLKERSHHASVTVTEEVDRARNLYKESTTAIHNVMKDVRMGKQVNVQSLEPMAEHIIYSVFRNSHAMTGVSRIKTKDEYTFMHCVSVAGLMATFAKEMNMSDEAIYNIAMGGLIHDIGKTLIPNEILNKPGKLEDDEMAIMKKHVNHSQDILESKYGLPQESMDVALQHHERIDGSGYPLGLKSEEISTIGKMSAIVDVYDALTSVRVYKDAWEPTQTLKKMLEWSEHHFDKELVHAFIRCLGIYPVGSVVELESGLIGIVLDQSEDLLKPKLRIIYNKPRNYYEPIRDIELEKIDYDRILSFINPVEYNINIARFL